MKTQAWIGFVLVCANILLIGGYPVLFRRGRDAAFKRRWYPWYIAVVMGFWVPSLVVISIISPDPRGRGPSPLQLILVAVLFVVAIPLIISQTRFCDACGAAVAGHWSDNWRRWRYCHDCGTKLGAAAGWMHWICPGCGLRISPMRSGFLVNRYRYCPECGAKLVDGPEAARKKGRHEDLFGTDWNFGPEGQPFDAKKTGGHDNLLDP